MGRGHLACRPGSVIGPGRLAESSHDRDFRLADLEGEQQEGENNKDEKSDEQAEGISFHDKLLGGFGGGHAEVEEVPPILSSRSKMSTSWVLVVSITYFRALAVARTKVWR